MATAVYPRACLWLFSAVGFRKLPHPVCEQKPDRHSVWYFGGSQSGGFCHPSDFSGLGALCRHFTHHHIRLLCVPTGSTLLSVDFYRTCADVGVYANSASAFWWADHDLVVYRICAHLMRSAGVWHGRFCEEKIPDGRKTI